MHTRKIEINLNEEFHETTFVRDHTVQAAIGYLTTWAIHSEKYCVLKLWGGKDGELTANYYDASGALTYSILGLRDRPGDYYSFHS